MTDLPSFHVYDERYSGKNYGVHALCFSVGDLDVYFSYQTPVAFRGPSTNYRIVVRENVWGPTTGRHLNAIDDGDKKSRVGGREFEKLLAEALASKGDDHE